MIKENLAALQKSIGVLAKKAGRDEKNITLIAVSKTKPNDLVKEALEAGQVDFGENRVQEIVSKHEAFPDVNWHMIGTLQRNKVKYIIPFVHLIHSVDSPKLLKEVSKQAVKHNREVNCLLQLNISDEPQKSGMSEQDAELIFRQVSQYPGVRIIGFMGMAMLTDNKTIIRNQFKRLKKALDDFSRFKGPQIDLQEISMGMSSDYDIAIEEGATMIRVGSTIFGARN